MPQLTLDDGQEDDDDEEEESDVKEDAVKLVRVTSRVLDLVPDSPSCSHANVHVEKVALCEHRQRVRTQLTLRLN